MTSCARGLLLFGLVSSTSCGGRAASESPQPTTAHAAAPKPPPPEARVEAAAEGSGEATDVGVASAPTEVPPNGALKPTAPATALHVAADVILPFEIGGASLAFSGAGEPRVIAGGAGPIVLLPSPQGWLEPSAEPSTRT
jgi:hypothetical protein